MRRANTPLVLMILDGWGERTDCHHNGIELARKPFFDSLKKKYPWTTIAASEQAVGLPEHIMGNSEVGHMNIGAGRIVYSGVSQIYKAIDDKSFFQNQAFLSAMCQVKTSNSTLHLLGLVSDGAVHSHQDHLYALLRMAKEQGIDQVAIHCFLDGRDTAPTDAKKYIQSLKNEIAKTGVGFIASLSGRYYAMDRDQRWERTEAAFAAMCGKSEKSVTDVDAYIERCLEDGLGDEFVPPASVEQAHGNTVSVSENDAMIFFNFRADRAKQITRAWTDRNFQEFDRGSQKLPAVYVCATPYDSSFQLPVAFMPNYPQKVLGEILALNGLKQLRLAETEKYAHVTFFFNGGRDAVFDGEERVLIKSPKEVATYDLKPEMSAFGVRDACLKALSEEKYDVIIMNFANADMVGHTAKPEPIVRAIETIDECLAKIVPEITMRGGVVLITADHGNAEVMVAENGEPMTAHTTNLVPFFVVSDHLPKVELKSGGRLCDIAPTMLKLLQIEQPKEMTGVALL